MKVVVTGATGFVGRYTVRRLLDSGYEVISITTNKSITDDVKEFINGSDVVTVNSLEEIPEEIIGGNSIIHSAWSNVQNTVVCFALLARYRASQIHIKNCLT